MHEPVSLGFTSRGNQLTSYQEYKVQGHLGGSAGCAADSISAQVMILWFVGSIPMSGSALTVEAAWDSLSQPLPLLHTLSLKINK